MSTRPLCGLIHSAGDCWATVRLLDQLGGIKADSGAKNTEMCCTQWSEIAP